MKKILIVITTAFVPWGGLTTVMMNYYQAMDKTGLQIDFASTNEPLRSLQEELSRNRSRYYCLGSRKKHLLTYRRKLKEVLKSEDYDVIHVNGNSSTIALELGLAKRLHIPKRIAHVHNSKPGYPWLHRILLPYFKNTYTNAFSCSKEAGKWIFGERYIVLNNAVDLEKYCYSPSKRKKYRERYKITDEALVIGHVGKFCRQKNYPFILETFYKFSIENEDALLVLVGDGQEKSLCEEWVRKRKLENKVLFLGMQTNVNELLSMMDIFFFPSLWEGLPLSVIEAQAAGLPCIVSANISEEVIATELVKALSLESDVKIWLEALENSGGKKRESACKAADKQLTEKGYNIQKNAEELKRQYGVTQ